jgi:hypothetical protein
MVDINVGGDGSEIDGDNGGGDSVNGDGSRGTSPSQQGAETETFVPQNSSVAAMELRGFFWKIANCFWVFRQETLYRRRGIVRRWTRGPHPWWRSKEGGRATLGCGYPLAPSGSHLVFVLPPGRIGVSVFVSSNSKNISYVAFLEHKNSRKQGTDTLASR